MVADVGNAPNEWITTGGYEPPDFDFQSNPQSKIFGGEYETLTHGLLNANQSL